MIAHPKMKILASFTHSSVFQPSPLQKHTSSTTWLKALMMKSKTINHTFTELPLKSRSCTSCCNPALSFPCHSSSLSQRAKGQTTNSTSCLEKRVTALKHSPILSPDAVDWTRFFIPTLSLLHLPLRGQMYKTRQQKLTTLKSEHGAERFPYTPMIYITYKHTRRHWSRRLSLPLCQVPHISHANYHSNKQPESSLLASHAVQTSGLATCSINTYALTSRHSQDKWQLRAQSDPQIS